MGLTEVMKSQSIPFPFSPHPIPIFTRYPNPMSTQISWPKHLPTTSLHQIIFDGICRGFSDSQIIYETCGIADKAMITFYRDAIETALENTITLAEEQLHETF